MTNEALERVLTHCIEGEANFGDSIERLTEC
jgi:hypothetical protein